MCSEFPGSFSDRERAHDLMQEQVNAKIWELLPPASGETHRFASRLGVSVLLATALMNRGIEDEDEAVRFLNPRLADLQSPFQMKDIDKAVARIMQARHRREKVAIYGDYDVDGITATALLTTFLQRMNVDAIYPTFPIDCGKGTD